MGKKNGHSNFAGRVSWLNPLLRIAMQVEKFAIDSRPPSMPINLIGRTKLRTGSSEHYSQSVSHSYWMKNKKEPVIPSLCFWEETAQLSPFSWRYLFGGTEPEGECTHAYLKTNLKCKGLQRWEKRLKSKLRACKSSATLCVLLSLFMNGQQSHCRWFGLMPLRPLRWPGPCKLIHCLIKAISKSIPDLTSRQYIVASPWRDWHVNRN